MKWKKYGRVAQATDDSIIWFMCFACWITNATDTHSEYVIVIAFTQQQWLCEHTSLLRCMNFARLLSVFPQTGHFGVWFAFLFYIPGLPGPLLSQETSYAD